MGSSAIEISNGALEQCNKDPITSLDDASKSARLCKRLFPKLRDELLRSIAPNFALRRAVLPALVAAPAWGYARAFQLPADCLRLLGLDRPDCWNPCAQDDAYRLEGAVIATDEGAPLNIRYVASVLEDLFDPVFASALEARMAAMLSMPLTNDARLLQLLEQRAVARMSDCRGANFAEAGDPVRHGASVLAVRR